MLVANLEMQCKLRLQIFARGADSRVLSSRTLASAVAFTSGSRRLGMNAAIPPMACAPRPWQVFTSSSV